MNQHLIQVKGTKLPKEGHYFCWLKNSLPTSGLVQRTFGRKTKRQWLAEVEWYLAPLQQSEPEGKSADVRSFSNRLDEIFEQGYPTKAQIIDAFNKFAQAQTKVSDEETPTMSIRDGGME